MVGTVPSDTHSIVSALTKLRFHVTVASSYTHGRQRLEVRPPRLLITRIRLREYNGLQLVLHGKSIRPGLAAVALADTDDADLRADAEALGATFVLEPVSELELAAAVARTISERKIHDFVVRPPFERRTGERRALHLVPASDSRRAERRRG